MLVFLAPSAYLKRLATALGLVSTLGYPATAERLIVRNYTTADGLAGDRAISLSVDGDGFLWVCTRNGLSRFDGSAFATFREDSGLPHSIVNHFLQTRAGTRWVATNGGGIARLEADAAPENGRVFTAFPVGDTDLSQRVNLLFETREGTLLAGTDGGLFRSPSGDGDPRFELVPLGVATEAGERPQVWSILEQPRGTLWIGTSAGLFRWDRRGRAGHVPVSPLQGADHVWTMVSDREGRLWLGHDLGLVVWSPPATVDTGFASVERPPLLDAAVPCVRSTNEETVVALPTAADQVCHWTPEEAPRGPGRLVRPTLETADGILWMTSHAGLITFDGTRFRVYAEPQTLASYVPATLAEDAGGDLWVTTPEGLARIRRQGFVHYTREDGLAEPHVSRIFRGPDGHLYAVTITSRIHRLAGDHWTAVRPNLPPGVGRGGRSTYGAVLVDHQGDWWVGSGEGLYRFPPVAAIEELERIPPKAHYTVADGLADDEIWHLFEDGRGDLWIAGRFPRREPLTRWRRATGKFQRFGPEHGLPAQHWVRSFTEDHAGNLWISLAGGGLARFDGTRFRVFSPGRDLPRGHVGAHLHVDRRGGLWATVDDVPIYIPDPVAGEPSIVPHPMNLNPASLQGDGVLTGDTDSIYVRTSHGLARLNPETGSYHRLGSGVPFATADRAYLDPRGTVWFATANGILRYQPQLPFEERPPPVWIGGVRIAGKSWPIPPMGATILPRLRLDREQRQIRIDYFGLGFGPDQPLRFQHRLEGVDDGWSDPSMWRSVLYAGLGSGRYRFRVRAVSATGQVSTRLASFAFTIPPPFWLRGWFLMLVAVALAALLTAAHRLRLRRLLALERVRTRIAADLHDDLGASLARVSLLSEAARRMLHESPEAAEPMLSEIGDTSRELVAAAGDIAYAIDPGRGRLDGLVARLRRFAEDLLVDTEIVWRLEVGGETAGVELSSDQRRHVLAILKEGLRNAVRHGRPRHLGLTLTVEQGGLSAELVDDGRGFAAGVPASGSEPLEGHGLRNMRRRAREMEARLEIDSDSGAGTRLVLQIPL